MCGSALTSMTALPISSRVPGGRLSSREVQIDEELIAGQRPAGPVLRDERDHAGVHHRSTASPDPARRRACPSCRRPCPRPGSSCACSSTSRALGRGRETINSTTPLSLGELRIDSRPASSSSRVRCRTVTRVSPRAVRIRPDPTTSRSYAVSQRDVLPTFRGESRSGTRCRWPRWWPA